MCGKIYKTLSMQFSQLAVRGIESQSSGGYIAHKLHKVILVLGSFMVTVVIRSSMAKVKARARFEIQVIGLSSYSMYRI